MIRRHSKACVFVLAFAAAACAAPSQVELLHDRIEHVTFFSDVLNRDMAFSVVLPADYDRTRDDWPVLYLLHGRGRHERSLIDDESTRASLLDAPFVTVLPRGEDGWYIDSPALPEDRYEAYLLELITVAERRYRLSTSPARRGLSGWSMGGYGCVRFAQRHPGRFAAVAPIIGLLDFPRTDLPEGQNYRVPVDRFTDDPKTWWQYNPMREVEALQDIEVLIVAADSAFDRTMNEHFAQKLEALSIEHTWRLLKGGHTLDIVRAAMPIVTQFMAQVLEDHHDQQ